MSQAKHDDNRVPSALAVDTNGATTPLRVDPVTKRLLIEIVAQTSASAPSNVPAELPDDQNRICVGGAVTDDGSATVTPLYVDSRNGYLFVDVLQE